MKRVTKAQAYHIRSYRNQQREELRPTNTINLRQTKRDDELFTLLRAVTRTKRA